MPESGWSVCHAPLSLQSALSETAASEYGAVAVGEDGDCLLIACAEPEEYDDSGASTLHGPDSRPHDSSCVHDEDNRREEVSRRRRSVLSALTGRPVRLTTVAPDELAIALARFGHADNLHALRWQRFRSLIGECGLGFLLHDEPADATADSGDRDSDRVAALASHMPEGWGPELLGLLYGLPHLRTEEEAYDPALCLLVPPRIRQDWAHRPLVPLGMESGLLVVGCASMPDEQILDAITAWSGLQVRCVLCQEEPLRKTMEAFRTAMVVDNGSLVPDSGMDRAFRTARSVLAGAPPRLGGLPTAEQRVARAFSLLRVGRGHAVEKAMPAGNESSGSQSATAHVEPDAVAAIPARLALSLEVLPLRSDQYGLHLAIAAGRPDAQLVLRLTRRLVGGNVHPEPVPEDDLRQALARYHGEDAVLPAQCSSKTFPPDTIHVDSHPFIRLESYAIQPNVISLIPREILEATCAIPVRRDGHVLWVAMAAINEERVLELGRGAGLSIRPLLARAEAIRARLRLCDVPASTLATFHTHPVVAYLQQHDRLGRSNALQILDTPGVAVDQALEMAGVLNYDEYAELAARLFGVPHITLRHSGKLMRQPALSGGRGHGKPQHEHIDSRVAREIASDEARALGMVPIRREQHNAADLAGMGPHDPDDFEGGVVVVAVADPWSPLVAAALAAQRHARYRLEVAPRPDIVAAIARAHGHAQLGERLQLNGVITKNDLDRAVRLHQTSGVRLGQALIHLNMLSEDQLAYFLAEQLELPFVSLQDMPLDSELAGLMGEDAERRLGILPVYEVGETLMSVTPDPLNEAARAEAEALTGRTLQLMVCTDSDFETALEMLYRDLYVARSSSDLSSRSPEESAARVVTRSQVWWMAGITLLGLTAFWREPLVTAVWLAAAITVVYAACSLYRGYLIYRALSHDLEVPVSAEELAALDETSLPIYTVLVPLYHEASVLPMLVAGLARLDYPSTKLDIKLLLEEDDEETLNAVAWMQLPPYVHPVIVPASEPRGKPKACNYGLIHAKGEYVVIFDAEDVPEPDQLKKAVIAFRKVPDEVACLQAKLSYYNANQNVLTRWFTIEYSMWFDLFLPGLDASRAPVPLGGTSNHFRTTSLLSVGAWDPHNVTEDADLGIRLYRRGWRTAVIESTTYEEATSEVYNWIRQRSRWVKGYVQTYLVHMRHPIQLRRAIGTKAFFSFNVVVGGTFFGFLVNPLLWCLTALWYLTHAHVIREIFPGAVFYLSTTSLLIGNITFVYLNVAGCMRPGMYDKVKDALFSPLYWALMSLAAWKGFLQLWTNPFYWEKTMHGQFGIDPQPAVLLAPAAAVAEQQVEVA